MNTSQPQHNNNVKNSLKNTIKNVVVICLVVFALFGFNAMKSKLLDEGLDSSQNSETSTLNTESFAISPTDETQISIENDTLIKNEISAQEQTQPEISATYTFRNSKLLADHYQKHGIEMGYNSEEEYEQGANKVISNSEALHKTEAEDGDDVYYVVDTNEFVIVSTDGYIRTYFCPSSGLAYYERQ